MKNKGFTLIELLVVIVIIGILAGIVLVAAWQITGRANDARIIASMDQIRKGAALYYSQNDYSFSGMSCETTDPNIKLLCDDIAARGGKKPSVDTAGVDIIVNAQAYCAEVKLNSGKYWCVDNVGTSKDYSSDPSCVSGATPDYTCD